MTSTAGYRNSTMATTSSYIRSAQESLVGAGPCTSATGPGPGVVHTTSPVQGSATKMMAPKLEGAGGHNNMMETIECAACKMKIIDKYLLEAVGKFWHEDCLRCVACQCRLGEVGSTLYLKQNMLLCRRDYLRLFGLTGVCSACNKNIPAFEMVMRARNNVYHLECFACQECSHRFCVGDQFYLCDNKILCQYDYNERMVFAQMFNNNNSNYTNLAQLKEHINKQVDDLEHPMPPQAAVVPP